MSTTKGREGVEVYVAVVPDGRGAWLAQELDATGTPVGVPGPASADSPERRWVFDAVAVHYPAWFASGRTVERAHDVSMVERILLGRAGRFGEPTGARAVVARRDGQPAVADDAGTAGEPTLFSGVADTDPIDTLSEVAAALADQIVRINGDPALKLLAAAESVSALAAVEMGQVGLPVDAAEHSRLLTEQLGPRPPTGARPARLIELTEQISAAFGFPVNPDSPQDLRSALQRAGFSVDSTRSGVLKQIDHPAVPLLATYKELARLFTANGWQWLTDWVQGGRFRTEYLPGGVVSGRWAARGGGALQIPRSVRRAVIAEPGQVFVVADAAQLEPRVLAALSEDPALQAVSTAADLYQALADDAFAGDRAKAKISMLGAMYGATTGESGRLLPILRARYPVAMAHVEDAARTGERGESVRTVLGRASPPPNAATWAAVRDGADENATAEKSRRGGEVARSWGRFTRNFIVQGSAADWASVWLSLLRQGIRDVPGAELVFFQHDELVVHVPVGGADRVAELSVSTAEQARRLVFPRARASTPVRPMIVRRYSDAK